MDSLAHWDYAVQFSGYEAAALILGIDPGKPGAPKAHESPIKAIFDRMALHYEHALKRHYFEAFNMSPSPAEAHGMDVSQCFELGSLRLATLSASLGQDEEDTAYTDWLMDTQSTAFVRQQFSRVAIAAWLDATDLDSVYLFRSDDNSVRRKHRWPWGDYDTVLLGHLEAAVREFWLDYDRDRPRTAPKNEVVADWLINERKITRNKAEAIASILRADGLPTGPRK